ncbi:hypothetical protein PFICI_04004 [Pestalotiopsis fici W106-1]|uniref:Uncharacterized protein n=1 Tax=Pestalotiopsis fici (strain W106-1 / CGMCC3.15140) TaxID=1229662 RepID=W3XIY7_PESFW|nr:uncharacterized protein PFICI_04004 [Pestalotiopsis fici W106-1]ETS85979.1 hypothetical protein PFICI_04004 [Pestalotiopsis fici W106-1]
MRPFSVFLLASANVAVHALPVANPYGLSATETGSVSELQSRTPEDCYGSCVTYVTKFDEGESAEEESTEDDSTQLENRQTECYGSCVTYVTKVAMGESDEESTEEESTELERRQTECSASCANSIQTECYESCVASA